MLRPLGPRPWGATGNGARVHGAACSRGAGAVTRAVAGGGRLPHWFVLITLQVPEPLSRTAYSIPGPRANVRGLG